MRIDRVKLITLMAQREVSASRLSQMSGLTKATISNVRSGKTCNEKTANAIADALAVPLACLRSEVTANAV